MSRIFLGYFSHSYPEDFSGPGHIFFIFQVFQVRGNVDKLFDMSKLTSRIDVSTFGKERCHKIGDLQRCFIGNLPDGRTQGGHVIFSHLRGW